MTIYFDTVELVNASPLKPKEDQRSFEVTIECMTEDYTDVEAMIARAGKTAVATLLTGQTAVQTTTKCGRLDMHGDVHEKCVIVGGVQVDEVEGTGGTYWKYKMRFVQDRRTPLITPVYQGDIMLWPVTSTFQAGEIGIEQTDPALEHTPDLCTAALVTGTDKYGDSLLTLATTVSSDPGEELAAAMTNLTTEITVI